MDGSTELEPINEAIAQKLASGTGMRRDVDDDAALTLQHGPTNAAAIWLRAGWLWTQGMEV